MFGEKKRGTNRCSPVLCSLVNSKQPCELSRHRNRTNNRLVFWLFAKFAEWIKLKASEKKTEYCKNGCKTLFWGNL